MQKSVLVRIPAQLLQQVDVIAEAECRTRAGLFREALRRYVAQFRRDLPGAGVVGAVAPQTQAGTEAPEG